MAASALVQQPTNCLGSYDHAVFNNLADVEVAADKFQPETHPKAMEALRAVIELCKMENIVGLQLMHKHFGLAPNERLVENGSFKASTTVPIEVKSDADVIPHMWKLSTASDGRAFLVPCEFVRAAGRTPDEIELAEKTAASVAKLAASGEFVQRFAAVVKEHNLMEFVGLSLAADDATMEPGVLPVEHIDPEARNLTVKAMPKESLVQGSYSETYWQFEAGKGPRTRGCFAVRVCQRVGAGHIQVMTHLR